MNLRDPRLNHRRMADGTTAVFHRYCDDHVYSHGIGVLALYYGRPTRALAARARRDWLARLPGPPLDQTRAQIGDCDGTILFTCGGADELPRQFHAPEK